MAWSLRLLRFRSPVLSPPFKSNETDNGQRRKGQVEDTGIQPLGGLFTQLLGGTGTNGALSLRQHRSQKESQ